MATVALSGIITPSNVVTATSTTTLSNKTLVAPALGTPASGVVTNLTGTASININGTVGATTPSTVVATTVQASTTMGVGGATPSASGSGISFPATQSASTDANTLDDYEEGTWTPSITFGGAAVGITYSGYTGGTYSKIGNRVFVTAILELSNKGSSTGAARIIGLPFTNASGIARYLSATIGGGNFTFTGQFWGEIQENTSSIAANYTSEAGTPSNLLDTNFTNTTVLQVSAHYSV